MFLWLLFVLVGVHFTAAEKVFIYNDWFDWHYEPTEEELQRGIAVQPSLSWGHQAREEKSARIVALGNQSSIVVCEFNFLIQRTNQVAAIPRTVNMLVP